MIKQYLGDNNSDKARDVFKDLALHSVERARGMDALVKPGMMGHKDKYCVEKNAFIVGLAAAVMWKYFTGRGVLAMPRRDDLVCNLKDRKEAEAFIDKMHFDEKTKVKVISKGIYNWIAALRSKIRKHGTYRCNLECDGKTWYKIPVILLTVFLLDE